MSTTIQPIARASDPRRNAFTLVELLVVISIIGILMALSIPVIGSVMNSVRVNAVKLESTAIENAIGQYRATYSDYPPDFSSWAVIQRHYRKVFPRIGTNDFELLYNLLHDRNGTTTKSDDTFLAAQMDRAEALAWALGGYSENIQRPFTGAGGPLTWTGPGTANTESYTGSSVTDLMRQTPSNFQISIDRPNAFHDFDLSRLNYTEVNASLPLNGTNRYLSTDDDDLFLTYASFGGGDGAPYLYFDARTYKQFDVTIDDFNGYFNSEFGGVRPFFGDLANANTSGGNYSDLSEALDAWNFMNPDSFQLISAGLDNNFGSLPTFAVPSFGNGDTEPIYFQYPTGQALAPRTDVGTPGELIISAVSKYQTATLFSEPDNPSADNITNFSSSELVKDLSN